MATKGRRGDDDAAFVFSQASADAISRREGNHPERRETWATASLLSITVFCSCSKSKVQVLDYVETSCTQRVLEK
jgi:hypothetical protein